MGETLEVKVNVENPPAKTFESKLFTFEILKLIKDSQQQHGLRHGDYQRYRSYCSRRLRRLRKVLKIPQGDRRHFKKRDVNESHLDLPNADERYLHIPLVLAERAWAYAMQLRQEANSELRKKFHLISKLRKACSHSIQLDTLCNSEKCDARTKLEAQAYKAWIHGTLQFELQSWTSAAENLKKAQVVYEKIASTLPDDEQGPYKQRIEEISPSLRYCAYNIGDEKVVDILELRSQGLLETLDTLTLQAKEKRAEEIMEVKWQGMKVTVRNEKIKLFLISIKNLDETISKAENTQARIDLLEQMLVDCRDAVSIARDEVRLGTSGSQLLLTYLLYIRLTRTIQRNECLIEQARKSQDIVRLYDIILQQMIELKDLSGLEENKDYQTEIGNLTALYRSFRCYHLAKTMVTTRCWREALLLYNLSLKHSQLVINSKIGEDYKKKALKLHNDVNGEIYVAQAQCVIDDTRDEPTPFPTTKAPPKNKKPLIDRLDEFTEDSQVLTKNPNLVTLPPSMEPTPCKPLFFDLAHNLLEFPDLTDKIESQQAKPKAGSSGMSGFVKGLFGWGGK